METYSGVARRIREIAGSKDINRPPLFPVLVTDVLGATCSGRIDEMEVTDIRLRAVVDGEDEQLLITPKVGSYILVADLSGGTFRQLSAISYSEIESVHIKIGATTLDMDAAGIVLNGGSLGGLVAISELTSKLNALVDTFNAHTHPVAGNAASATVNQAAPFSKGDYENEKVKQ